MEPREDSQDGIGSSSSLCRTHPTGPVVLFTARGLWWSEPRSGQLQPTSVPQLSWAASDPFLGLVTDQSVWKLENSTTWSPNLFRSKSNSSRTRLTPWCIKQII